jgi:tetratricopeptide (TPR) repeat protein
MQKIIWGLCLLACMGCRESTLEWGQNLLAAENYEKAQEAFSLSIQEDTTHWEAYYGRATCETELNLWPEALADFEKAYAMHPSAETCAGLGKGYWNQEDIEKAKAYLNRAIGMDPALADSYMNLGLIYVKEEAYPDALPYLLKAKGLYKQAPDELSMGLMITYFETKNDAACLEIIRSFKSADTVSSAVYEYHGRLLQRKKQYKQALKEYQAALNLDSTNVYAKVLVADVYAQQENYEAEIKERTRIIKQVEEEKAEAELIGLSYYFRGMAKDNAGDYRGALRDLDYSIALSDGRAWAYFCRTVAKIHLKDFSGALRDYQQAVRLEPDVAFDDYLTEDLSSYATFIAYAGRHGLRFSTTKSTNI